MQTQLFQSCHIFVFEISNAGMLVVPIGTFENYSLSRLVINCTHPQYTPTETHVQTVRSRAADDTINDNVRLRGW
jgi:hypothetical protein